MIEIKNVSKTIDKQQVLKDINLTLEDGKSYAIIGQNGSGKSMLLRLICGLISPDTGSVLINKEELKNNINKYNFGVLIEKPKFLNNLTGFENLEILASINNKINSNDIDQILKSVDLYDEKDKKYRNYSLGMKQKLGIAQALMENPDIILLDEPFSALDKQSTKKIRELILKLKKQDKLIIIATHSKEDVNLLCDEVLEMESGMIEKVR